MPLTNYVVCFPAFAFWNDHETLVPVYFSECTVSYIYIYIGIEREVDELFLGDIICLKDVIFSSREL